VHSGTQFLQAELLPYAYAILIGLGGVALVKCAMRAMIKGDTVRDKLIHFFQPIWALIMAGVALNFGIQYMETLFRHSAVGLGRSGWLGALGAEAIRQIAALQRGLIGISLTVGLAFFLFSVLSMMLSNHDLTRREHARRSTGVLVLCAAIALITAIVPWALGLTDLGGWVTRVR